MENLNFNRAAVFALLFAFVGVSIPSRSYVTWENPIIVLVLLGFSILLFSRVRYRLSFGFVVVTSVHLAMCAIQYLWFGSFHPKHLIIYPLGFFVAYSYINGLGRDLFFYLEDIIVKMALISNIFWIIDVGSFGWMRGAISGFYIFQPYSQIIDSYLIFYTVVNEGVESIVYRNSGFAWEPGAYAVICAIALVLRYFRINGLRVDFWTAVLIFSIVSSQSTTGYTLLLMIFAFKVYGDYSGVLRYYAAPVIVLMFVAVSSLPFMQGKMADLWGESFDELITSASSEWNADNPVAAQRFLSFKMDYEDFKMNPVFGYGGRDEEMYIKKAGLNIVSVSGVGKILATFGILGGVAFLCSLMISSINLGDDLLNGNRFIIGLVIFLILISYSVFYQPLLMVFWLYGFLKLRLK